MSTVVQNFDVWKKFLGQRVEQAEKLGISQDTIAELAYEIGDFLDEKVDPANHSNRALKELWGVADENERHTIARLMVKLAKSLKASKERILTWFEHPISNAVAEGFNSIIQQLRAAARGFRNFEHYRYRILFYCGKLALRPQ